MRKDVYPIKTDIFGMHSVIDYNALLTLPEEVKQEKYQVIKAKKVFKPNNSITKNFQRKMMKK